MGGMPEHPADPDGFKEVCHDRHVLHFVAPRSSEYWFTRQSVHATQPWGAALSTYSSSGELQNWPGAQASQSSLALSGW